MYSRLIVSILALATTLLVVNAHQFAAPPNDEQQLGEVKRKQRRWVDSVFQSLTPEERIGQLFMVSAYSNRNEKHVQDLENLIRKYNIGGLIFFQGGPGRQARITNRLQSVAKVPLLIGMDAEWGLSMRLDSTWSFPRQMTLGAQQNTRGTYELGIEMARQAKRLGVHVSFSPAVDVNSNPANPVIGFRSFGENVKRVTAHSLAYMHGLQDGGVMANAKHFPGHGDAATDSHLDLPVINRSMAQLDTLELEPFRALFKAGVKSVMVGHLQIPALDSSKRRPTSLSRKVVTELLKEDMRFEGLIFTDGLNMKGASKYYKPGQLEVEALRAGNDILLCPEDVPAAFQAIWDAIDKDILSQRDLDKRVRKVLEAKYWVGLNSMKPVELQGLDRDLNPASLRQYNRKQYTSSATVVNVVPGYLPIKHVESQPIVALAVQADSTNEYLTLMQRYAPLKAMAVPEKPRRTVWDSVRKVMAQQSNSLVIISYHNLQSKAKNYNLPDSGLALVPALLKQGHQVVVVAFGNAYALKNFSGLQAMLAMNEDNSYTRQVAPQLLFGSLQAEGRLPVTPKAGLPRGTGETTPLLGRLAYDEPSAVGMSAEVLTKIDSIAADVIREKMAPGMQVLVARQGKVVFHKAYGKQTYDSTSAPVTLNTRYDLASVTKVAGTLQAVMQLAGQGRLNLDYTLKDYLYEVAGTNKAEIRIKDLLLHRAGLQPFVPYWKRTMVAGQPSFAWYCDKPEDDFTAQVSHNWYARPAAKDSVWEWILASDLVERNREGRFDTKYSDLGFMLLQRLVERITGKPLDQYLHQEFYSKLGIGLTYLPLKTTSPQLIAPTELDALWRKTTVKGTVHDPMAALVGGVAGHAGLFGTANDLAILAQMNLQDGYYGGTRYISPGTVPAFARKAGEGSRGLGWDKPAFDKKERGAMSQFASPETYGHTGFTGTCVWVDPVYDLVFVFLSNRVYPDANNKKLADYNIRPRIHDVVYQSLFRNYPTVWQNEMVRQ